MSSKEWDRRLGKGKGFESKKWYDKDPKTLRREIYWQKSQIPPTHWKGWPAIVKQLQKKDPAPQAKYKKMLNFKEEIEESDAPQTTVGGVGGGMIGEPPGPTKRKKKYEVFAGSNVFEVSSDVFMKCKGEKGRYDRYVKHVGNDRVGEGIRSYGRENPGRGIIIKDSVRGTMMVLRRGKK